MKKLFSLMLIALLLPGAIVAQKLSAAQEKKVNEIFAKRKVVHFKFQVLSMQEASGLAKIIKIDSNKGTTFFAHADREQFSKFIVKNYNYTIVPGPVQKAVKKKQSQTR